MRDIGPNDGARAKYLTFRIAEEEYGLEVLKVRDINRLGKITRVPGTKSFLRGVVNLRGKIIPVVDLGEKFGWGPVAETEWTVTVVVQFEHEGRELLMGLLVDKVVEVVSLAESQIEPPPAVGANMMSAEFLLGVGKLEERVIFLLDIAHILTADESRIVAGSFAQAMQTSEATLAID